jgi:hypothetical protein
MTFARIVYAVTAAVTLVWTQWLVFNYMVDGGTMGGAWAAMTGNPVAMVATVDLSAVLLTVIVFMVIEGRRIGLRFWWLYPLLCALIAIGVGLPLFLLARSLHNGKGQAAASPSIG